MYENLKDEFDKHKNVIFNIPFVVWMHIILCQFSIDTVIARTFELRHDRTIKMAVPPIKT